MGSVRAKDVHEPHVVEAIRRGKFKFAGRQKILKSLKWGFTAYPREEYVKFAKVVFLVQMVIWSRCTIVVGLWRRVLYTLTDRINYFHKFRLLVTVLFSKINYCV